MKFRHRSTPQLRLIVNMDGVVAPKARQGGVDSPVIWGRGRVGTRCRGFGVNIWGTNSSDFYTNFPPGGGVFHYINLSEICNILKID
jgi:hypothetical protein